MLIHGLLLLFSHAGASKSLLHLLLRAYEVTARGRVMRLRGRLLSILGRYQLGFRWPFHQRLTHRWYDRGDGLFRQRWLGLVSFLFILLVHLNILNLIVVSCFRRLHYRFDLRRAAGRLISWFLLDHLLILDRRRLNLVFLSHRLLCVLRLGLVILRVQCGDLVIFNVSMQHASIVESMLKVK